MCILYGMWQVPLILLIFLQIDYLNNAEMKVCSLRIPLQKIMQLKG